MGYKATCRYFFVFNLPITKHLRVQHQVDKSYDESMVAGMLKQAPSLDLNKDQVDDYVREVAFTLLSGIFSNKPTPKHMVT